MSIKTNYHTHSHFCDGKGSPEEYVISAIEKGMKCLGFSGHSPVPFASSWNMKWESLVDYYEKIDLLEYKYENQIQIFRGLEVDFIPGTCSIADFDKDDLDFYVGSVHYLKQFDDGAFFNFDENAARFDLGLNQIFGGDIKKLVSQYFYQVCWMIENFRPPIIGHLDLVKKFNAGNRFFDENEKWFVDAAMPALELAKKYDLIVEINTKGKARGVCETFYPGPTILKHCQQMGIALTASADAHSPADVMCMFDTVELLLRYLEVKSIRIFDQRKWVDVGF